MFKASGVNSPKFILHHLKFFKFYMLIGLDMGMTHLEIEVIR